MAIKSDEFLDLIIFSSVSVSYILNCTASNLYIIHFAEKQLNCKEIRQCYRILIHGYGKLLRYLDVRKRTIILRE